ALALARQRERRRADLGRARARGLTRRMDGAVWPELERLLRRKRGAAVERPHRAVVVRPRQPARVGTGWRVRVRRFITAREDGIGVVCVRHGRCANQLDDANLSGGWTIEPYAHRALRGDRFEAR